MRLRSLVFAVLLFLFFRGFVVLRIDALNVRQGLVEPPVEHALGPLGLASPFELGAVDVTFSEELATAHSTLPLDLLVDYFGASEAALLDLDDAAFRGCV